MLMFMCLIMVMFVADFFFIIKETVVIFLMTF